MVNWLELNLPKALTEEISEDELRLFLAMMLYKERKISMGQAAKLAGLTLSDFVHGLGKHKIGFTNVFEYDFEEELRRIK